MDPAVGLCLRFYGGPGWVAVSCGRGTPVPTRCFLVEGAGAAPITSPHGQTESSKVDYVLAKSFFSTKVYFAPGSRDFTSCRESSSTLWQGEVRICDARFGLSVRRGVTQTLLQSMPRLRTQSVPTLIPHTVNTHRHVIAVRLGAPTEGVS